MRRPHTRWSITVMADKQSVKDRPECFFEGKAMGISTVKGSVPSLMPSTCPYPALAEVRHMVGDRPVFINLRPKASSSRRRIGAIPTTQRAIFPLTDGGGIALVRRAAIEAGECDTINLHRESRPSCATPPAVEERGGTFVPELYHGWRQAAIRKARDRGVKQ